LAGRISVSRRVSPCSAVGCGVHGRMADGVRACRAVGVTVGVPRTATDGPPWTRLDARIGLPLVQPGPAGKHRHETARRRPIARCPVQPPLTVFLASHVGNLTAARRNLPRGCVVLSRALGVTPGGTRGTGGPGGSR
jgi:hypothetical protein